MRLSLFPWAIERLSTSQVIGTSSIGPAHLGPPGPPRGEALGLLTCSGENPAYFACDQQSINRASATKETLVPGCQ